MKHRKFDDYLNQIISNLDKKKCKFILEKFFQVILRDQKNWISDLKSIVVVRIQEINYFEYKD